MKRTEEKLGHSYHILRSIASPMFRSSFVSNRLIAISATVPNLKDVAQWLKDTASAQPAVKLAFDATYRPVPLSVHVIGVYRNEKRNGGSWFTENSKLTNPHVLC
eukprot:Selendium_serpulae@DN8330_c0_g1_i1.p1